MAVNEADAVEVETAEEKKAKEEEEKKEGSQPEEDTEHWLTMSVNAYQKSTAWFVVAVALCALKGATRFAVVLAYM